MKSMMIGAMTLALLSSSAAFAKPDHGNGNGNGKNRSYGNSEYGRHEGRHDNGRHNGWAKDRGNSHRWSRGDRMGYNDWNSARRVDYRRYNLRQPPRGYEWRQQGNQFVLAAIATGLIASIILSSGR